MKNKKRLDVLVVEQALAETREKAQALILAGQVLSGDQLLDKPGMKLDSKVVLRVRGDVDPYVSRGAQKLKAALEVFQIDLKNATCLDVGASTGGFTQVCLEFGAKKVIALDVGHNQLHWKIRSDPRVMSLEGVNIREITESTFSEKFDFICVDTSFISLRLVLPALPYAPITIALIKPQHEVGKGQVGKGGIVRDPDLHRQVKETMITFAQSLGFKVKGLIESPIKGTTGNTEFLICLQK